ncbi:MAG: hypothetical protein AAFY56_06440 [Pseudomonadota bacterium]
MSTLSRTFLLGTFAIGLFAGNAIATELRVRGEVTSINGDTVTVATPAGQAVDVTLSEPVVLYYRDIPLDDIDAGAYIAVPSIAMPDGTRQALGLVVFPEAMRGMNEGFKPWDLTAESKMTNATVAQVVSRGDERVLTVAYGEEEQTILVPEHAQVSTFAPAPEIAVETGQNVVIFADDSSGAIIGKFVGVHENGALPPV